MLIGLLAPSAFADGRFESIQVGFDSIGRVGMALPIRVRAAELPPSTEVTVFVESLDPAGNLFHDVAASGVTDAEGNLDLSGVFRAGRLEGELTCIITERDSDTTLCQTAIAHRPRVGRSLSAADSSTTEAGLQLLKQDAFCVLTVGQLEALQLVEEKSRIDLKPEESPTFQTLTVTSNAELPSDRRAYASVDALILQSDFTLEAQQLDALRRWVLAGGELLISAGKNSPQLADSLLGQWLDTEFDFDAEPRRVRSQTLASFQSYVPGARVLTTLGTSVSLLRINSPEVRVVLPSIDGPLIARRAVGAGLVTVVSADLTQRPLSSWNSLPQLYEMLLLGKFIDGASAKSARGSRISSSGVNDLGTQLLAAGDAVLPQNRRSTWVVIALLAAWIVVAGPFDYIIVTRILRRPHLTWLTFPTIVAAGCLVVWAVRPAAHQSDQARQIQLVDLMESQGRLTQRSRVWSSVATSSTQRAELAVNHASLLTQQPDYRTTELSWSGRAENVYGGMYREGGAGLGRLRYFRQVDPDSEVEALTLVPLQVGSSASLFAEEFTQFESNPVFQSSFRVAGAGLLEGDFQHSLPLPLEHWVVFHGNRVYRPGRDATSDDTRIAPGTTWNRRTSRVRASDLRSFLNGVRIVRSAEGEITTEQGQSVSSPYSTLGRDPSDILLMASLYEAAGGFGYVGLQNSQLRQDDLTDQIRLNYALVMGTVSAPLATLNLDGSPVQNSNTTSIVRFIVPVRLQAPDPSANSDRRE